MGFFPSCSICGKYSPFLIDEKVLQSEDARQALRNCIGCSLFVLCPNCLNPEKLTPDSLLGDDDFRQLVLGFVVSDLGDFQSLGIDQVVVISKETRMNLCFKELTCKPFPKTVKLRKLRKAFPPVHGMCFQDYGSEENWFRDLQQRCNAISNFYLDLVERTPLHERTSNQAQGRSERGTRNISMNSSRSVATNRNDSESDRSESFNISSQSQNRSKTPTVTPNHSSSTDYSVVSMSIATPARNVGVAIEPYTPQRGTRNISINSSRSVATNRNDSESSSQSQNRSKTPTVTPNHSSSTDYSAVSMSITTPARNVGVAIEPYSPQPGPSGLQQSRYPVHASRRRSPEAINPRPESFREVRIAGARLPRLSGG
ncbi:uncharacterized protein LOC126579920 isoform X2 [Anopheles aquasalis]|uniref:uncharacterized protein LOC126579920 isoform X2 n=1 Tax=Anopheles aquasalis TaxID=42839 RepID=UPI00215A781B|nr:uncharacterized protein LOC126579920 isoform X2 [Anopheles aquasalis]